MTGAGPKLDSCPVSGYGVTFLRRNDGVGVTLLMRGGFETRPYEGRLMVASPALGVIALAWYKFYIYPVC